MKEIEVKARIHDLPSILSRLVSLGCQLSPVITQHDRIFIPRGASIPTDSGTNVLRIREQDGKYVFTLKQMQSNQLDCIEKELEISDPAALAEIFLLLGFEESVGVKKKRRQAKWNTYTICVDEVEGLGNYIEVEKLSSEDGPTVQKELFSFLETLGLTKDDQEHNGYDILLFRKMKQ